MSNNEVQQYRSGSSILSSDTFRSLPRRATVEGRAIARADWQSVVAARAIVNEAAVVDFTNELKHQIETNEI